MIIVPTKTPGVNILRDVPTMGEPDHKTGEPGGHAEILYENVRVPFENIVGGEAGIGQGFALAQKRLGPGRIHHAMRWLGQSQRAFDMLCERALTRYTHGSILAEKQMVQDWIAESYAEMQAARLLTLQAGVEDGSAPRRRQALQRCPRRDRRHQVLGREGALQRHRPGDPDPRLTRVHHRPAARVDVPRTAVRRASTTGPTRCTR